MVMMESIFESLQGLLIPEAQVPGVENLFAEGRICDRRYGEICAAYDRLCARLGQENEDEDVEMIINAGMEICRELSYAMFRYGEMMAQNKTL